MTYLKALVGAAIAGLGSAATAVTDGHVTAAEWIAIASTTLVALYGVWQVPGAAPAVAGNGGEAAERLAAPPVGPSNVTKVGRAGYPGGEFGLQQPPTTRGNPPKGA